MGWESVKLIVPLHRLGEGKTRHRVHKLPFERSMDAVIPLNEVIEFISVGRDTFH